MCEWLAPVSDVAAAGAPPCASPPTAAAMAADEPAAPAAPRTAPPSPEPPADDASVRPDGWPPREMFDSEPVLDT